MKIIKTLIVQFLLTIIFSISALAQGKQPSVSGIITSSDGQPAAYVNVGLKGTKKFTSTNE